MSEDLKNVIGRMCGKLANTIGIADDMAAHEYDLSTFDGDVAADLAEQFAQAAAIVTACARLAEQQGQPETAVQQYRDFAEQYAVYAEQLLVSGEHFEDGAEVQRYLARISAVTLHFLTHYKINPIVLHRHAIDALTRAELDAAPIPANAWVH